MVVVVIVVVVVVVLTVLCSEFNINIARPAYPVNCLQPPSQARLRVLTEPPPWEAIWRSLISCSFIIISNFVHCLFTPTSTAPTVIQLLFSYYPSKIFSKIINLLTISWSLGPQTTIPQFICSTKHNLGLWGPSIYAITPRFNQVRFCLSWEKDA